MSQGFARLAFAFGFGFFASFAGAAHAEQIALGARYQPGDVYALSLRTTTQTAVRARGRERHREDVTLQYQASVLVLETDAAGRPVRERHQGVKLSFERPGETGSLFRDGASFEVRRDGDGEAELFASDARLERDVEKVVGEILASQLEHGALPALLQPGRAVEVGESWELDPKGARQLLRARGMRVIDLGGAATATLAQVAGEDGQRALAIRYRIPVSRWEPRELPANARTSESDATVEGEIRLSSDRRPVAHTASLVRRVAGVKTASGVAAPLPWSIESAEASEQSTRPLARGLAANL